ncbi:hypothetical protein G9A89_020411 [Geosiphon pyriformis]|nr:hypothetical protein G9A89_020411 [Geosiphon pyriformis]
MKKQNLPEKSIKFSGPIIITINYPQYYLKTTTEREKNNKGKGKKKEEVPIPTTTTTYIPYTYTLPQPFNYCQPKLIYIDYGKKLLSIGNNKSCLACREILLDEEMWNDVLEQRGICDELCQYMILISDWVRKKTSIKAVWRRAVKHLDNLLTKIEETSPEEIRIIKNNLPESIELNWDPNPNIILEPINPEQFHKHYQELAPTWEKQEQCLEEINT